MVRTLSKLPDFEQRLNEPKALIEVVSREVEEMVAVHCQLSKSEGEETAKAVKRKIWGFVDERIKEGEGKRKKGMVKKVEMRIIKREDEVGLEIPGDLEGVGEGSAHVEDGGDGVLSVKVEEDETEDVDMMDYDSPPRTPMPESFISPASDSDTLPLPLQTQGQGTFEYLSSSPESIEPPTITIPSSAQGRSTYKYPSSSDSSAQVSSSPPMFDRPSNPTPSRGQASVYQHFDTPQPKTSHGFYHPGLKEEESDEEDTSPIRQNANSAPTHTQTSSYQHQDTPRPRTSNSPHHPTNDADTSSNASQTTQNPARVAKKAARPTSAFAVPHIGSRLFTLLEGFSPQQSPPEGTTQYRAAGTKKFYHEVEQQRKFRRGFRSWFGFRVASEEGQEEEENENENEVQAQQPDITAATVATEGEETGSTTSPLQPVAQKVKEEEEEEPQPLSSPTTPVVPSPTKLPLTPPHRPTDDHAANVVPTETSSPYPGALRLEKAPESTAPLQPRVISPTPVPAPVRPTKKVRSVPHTPLRNRSAGEAPAGVRKSARIANKSRSSVGR